MKKIFIDTSGWVALKNKRDGLYEKAQALNRALLLSNHSYVTTNFVLDEAYTLLLNRTDHSIAVELGEEVRSSKLVTVGHISEEIEDEAWVLFKKRSDKTYSFTDCTSFAVMKRLKIKESFTDDHHLYKVVSENC